MRRFGLFLVLSFLGMAFAGCAGEGGLKAGVPAEASTASIKPADVDQQAGDMMKKVVVRPTVK